MTTTDPAEALTDLEPLQAMLADAVIVGVGEATRAAREVTTQGHRVVRLLVEHLGFRVLAIQDDEAAVERVNAYIRGHEGDARAAMSDLWTPWRTEEMVAVLEWARAFNQRNPSDALRIVGLDPVSARPSDYQAVIDHVVDLPGDRLAELRLHYDTIVTAHEVPEHVQHARGSHPGHPFVEHARDAYDLVASLPAPGAALEKAKLILDWHAGSFAAGGFDYALTRRRSVAALTSLPRNEGAKVVYWEGMAFTANAARVIPAALLDPFQSVGNELRGQLGSGYFSLLIAFAQGNVSGLHPGQRVPRPMAESADATLTGAGPDRYLLDLRASRPGPVNDWLRGPHKLRIIGGVYDATADSDHYLTTGRLDEWFDAVLQVGAVTPTTLLRPARRNASCTPPWPSSEADTAASPSPNSSTASPT
ncbi:erythromycin esterase family protein [Streptomyces johnsoniae]|uniref:Erythromycin esterase family protein n=1 Tax=Streptomyces johnsoniae TaxID=3075532 RepID=A0ABU2S8N7_9ACTN|nr:erythromycin esterase family protein [Streptomyces sp. DSM 41886]MDT0445337.1 erythromycin esterase family protein [Streptomyces sp. DSM 41886]